MLALSETSVLTHWVLASEKVFHSADIQCTQQSYKNALDGFPYPCDSLSMWVRLDQILLSLVWSEMIS